MSGLEVNHTLASLEIEADLDKIWHDLLKLENNPAYTQQQDVIRKMQLVVYPLFLQPNYIITPAFFSAAKDILDEYNETKTPRSKIFSFFSKNTDDPLAKAINLLMHLSVLSVVMQDYKRQMAFLLECYELQLIQNRSNVIAKFSEKFAEINKELNIDWAKYVLPKAKNQSCAKHSVSSGKEGQSQVEDDANFKLEQDKLFSGNTTIVTFINYSALDSNGENSPRYDTATNFIALYKEEVKRKIGANLSGASKLLDEFENLELEYGEYSNDLSTLKKFQTNLQKAVELASPVDLELNSEMMQEIIGSVEERVNRITTPYSDADSEKIRLLRASQAVLQVFIRIASDQGAKLSNDSNTYRVTP